MIRLIATLALLASPTAAGELKCFIEVGGQVYLDGPCEYASEAGTITVGVDETEASPYFVYLFPEGDVAEAFWNGVERESHAHTPLGTLTRGGDCWTGADAKVCAYPLQGG